MQNYFRPQWKIKSVDKTIIMPGSKSKHNRDRPAAFPVLLCAILILSAGLLSTFFITWERPVLETVQPVGDTAPGAILVQAAKYCGNGFFQVIPFAFLLTIAWRQKDSEMTRRMLAAIYAVAASGIVANILKFVIGKARPGEKLGNWHVVPFSTANDFHSFPSGHTTTSFALAFVLSGFYPRFAPIFFGAAVLIGAGRIMGESHFPGDVMGGAVIGILAGWAVMRYYRQKMGKTS